MTERNSTPHAPAQPVLGHRLEAILERLADGITVHDAHSNVIFANQTAAQICGYASPQEFVGTSGVEVLEKFELFDEQGAPFELAELPGRRVLAGAESAQTVLRFVERATGRQRWAAIRAAPMLGEGGTIELAINFWQDVTENKRREEHDRYLARAAVTLAGPLDYETRLRSLAELLVPDLADWCVVHLLEQGELRQVAVAHADPVRLQSAREYAEKFPPQRGQGVWRVVETGKSELYEQLSDELLRQGARGAEHLEVLRRAGMSSLLLVPLRVNEQVSGVMALISANPRKRYDASDLAFSEELGRRAGAAIENARLYEAERRARLGLELVARAGEAFSSTLDYEQTLHNVVDIVLPALADFAFFDIVEGDEVRRIAAAHDDPEVDQIIKDSRWVRSARTDKNFCALSSGVPGFHPTIDADFRRDLASGPEHLQALERLGLCSMVTVPLEIDGSLLGSLTLCYGKSRRHHSVDDLGTAEELARRGAVAVVQARLYAEAHESARAAEAAAQAAEEANTIKDEFLATVSHELRTPLNAIIGWATLLRANPSAASLAKGLDVICRNGQAQAEIIDDILDVSRIITGKLRLELEPIDLRAVVEDAIEVVGPSASAKQIEIEFPSRTEPCELVADRHRLQQVVWNLLSNAVKFTPAGGRIQARIERANGELALSIQDNGCGIEPNFLPFVFDRFKQADGSTTRRVGGLGLGLAIVRHVVELHGGRVTVDSPGRGAGTTFSIRLPLRAAVPALQKPLAAAQRRAGEGNQTGAGTSLDGLRVLLVDDELDARELLQAVLEGHGARVHAAGSVSEALAVVKRFGPQLLVSDIGMPDEDGYSLIGKLRAAGETLPAIALTAYTRREDRDKALAAGFTAHVGKPVWPDDLLAAIANLRNRERAQPSRPKSSLEAVELNETH